MSKIIFFRSDNVIVAAINNGGQEHIDYYSERNPDLKHRIVDDIPDGFECGPMAKTVCKWDNVTETIIIDNVSTLAKKRREISDQINSRTRSLIVDRFSYLGHEFRLDETTQSELFEKFQLRELLNYTYRLKINSDEGGAPVYYPINSVVEFENLYSAWIEHKNKQLKAGRDLKSYLKNMNESELENFVDQR